MKINLTSEQQQIVNSNEDIVVEARAGTGKTTTLIEYSLKNNSKKKLYFAFNKSIADEAKLKFSEAEVNNITISTAHALAYKEIIVKQQYKLGYNPNVYGISKHFSLNKDRSKFVHSAISKFEAFCNSSCKELKDLEFVEILKTDRAKQFYSDNRKPIDKLSEDIWNEINSKKIDCSHSFYLKKYQLSNPKLNYDIILLDEGQDANPVILDIFFNQSGRKIIVGDNHQAIYSWRGAINALKQVPYKKYYLTESFRFPQYIANYGLDILSFKEGKEEGFDFSKLKLLGRGKNTEIKTKAVISRSNLAILEELINEKSKYQKPYIEGGIDTIIKTSSGFDLLELLALKQGNRSEIKNYILHSFKNLKELCTYYEDLDDTSVTSSVIFIEKYEQILEREIESLKGRLVKDQNEADCIFSTIHKAKGKEWDQVRILSSSFEEGFPYKIPESITNKKTQKKEILTEDDKKKMLARWLEELNIYYVAVTRAKVRLFHNLDWLDQKEINSTNLSDDLEQEISVENQNLEFKIQTLSNTDLIFTVDKEEVSIQFNSGRKLIVEKSELKKLITAL